MNKVQVGLEAAVVRADDSSGDVGDGGACHSVADVVTAAQATASMAAEWGSIAATAVCATCFAASWWQQSAWLRLLMQSGCCRLSTLLAAIQGHTATVQFIHLSGRIVKKELGTEDSHVMPSKSLPDHKNGSTAPWSASGESLGGIMACCHKHCASCAWANRASQGTFA